MTALNKKLFRDLWRLKGQVFAIAFVIASGIATLIMSLSTVEALDATTKAYYERYQFADVFATAKRVPNRVSLKLALLPGVQTVQTRISKYAIVDIKDFAEPIISQIVSVPDNQQPLLNKLVIKKGSWVSSIRDDEVIVSEPFAQAHQLQLNDTITVVMNGYKRRLFVVGIALSPEFIYSIGPGALMPDDARFGVMWMSRKALEAAFDLEGAFNDVNIKLRHNSSETEVLDNVDKLLAPYGGVKAFLRKDQISNWFIMNEIAQQKTMATILPTIFIIVSVFLTNMVLSRLIATERTEIGLIKAFGYSKVDIAWHYCKMVLLICALGAFIGFVMGASFGRLNTQMYAELFRFPLLIYQPSPYVFLLSSFICTFAAVIGALTVVNKAVTLPPAEAMTPPSPPVYKHAFSFNNHFTRWLDQPSRIAIRQLGRWPIRSFTTSCGIAFSVGLIIMNLQWTDSLSYLSRAYFFDAQRQDIMLGVTEPLAKRAIHDFEHLPGVLKAEPLSFVNAEFLSGSIVHKGAISGIERTSQLQPIFDDDIGKTREVPEHGMLMASRLAQKLNAKVGDLIWVNILDGKRPSVQIQIVGTYQTYIGMPVTMNLDELNRILQEPPSFRFVNLLIDTNKKQELFAVLKNTPRVSAVMLRESALASFNGTVIDHLMIFITMFVTLASILAIGVTYNSTRIALSERARELATLRVLGFTKGEISYVLLGEVMFLVIFALPLGCFFGWILVNLAATAFDTEMFRIPLVIELSTYGYAMAIIIVSAVVSALIVRKRVDTLDLIGVLKTRE